MSSNDETTADNPQRIDLTQFEGISPAESWGVIYPDRWDRICVATGEALYHPHVGTDDYNVRRANMALMAAGPNLLAELKRCYDLIDSLQNEMYGFKEALWAEALCDESENVVGVEAYPGDQKREKKVFFISCDLVDEMYDFFQQHGRLDLSKNASQ